MRTIVATILVLSASVAIAGQFAGTPSAKEVAWIDTQKGLLKARLKDPKSAQYRNLRVAYYKGKTPIVCGDVNAKSSFGGYMGYQRWIGADVAGTFLESDVADFGNLWNTFCADGLKRASAAQQGRAGDKSFHASFRAYDESMDGGNLMVTSNGQITHKECFIYLGTKADPDRWFLQYPTEIKPGVERAYPTYIFKDRNGKDKPRVGQITIGRIACKDTRTVQTFTFTPPRPR